MGERCMKEEFMEGLAEDRWKNGLKMDGGVFEKCAKEESLEEE